MAQSYITLESSNDSISERFRVIQQNYAHVIRKAASVEDTINGGVNVTMGGIKEMYNYIIKVRHTESEANYGNLADLQNLFELNDPGGTPTNVITLYDHHYSSPGDEKEVYLLGDFVKAALGCEIEGSTAWYHIKLTLLVKP